MSDCVKMAKIGMTHAGDIRQLTEKVQREATLFAGSQRNLIGRIQ